MTPPRHVLRGASRLALDAVTRLTDIVEAMHHDALPRPLRPAPAAPAAPAAPPLPRTGGLTGLVYDTLRAAAGLTGAGLDALLADSPTPPAPTPPPPDAPASLRHDALVSVLNGVVGDHLAATANPLAIPMRLRRDGRALELTAPALAAASPAPTSKLLVLLHGSCSSDRQWRRHGHDHGEALARDLGFIPVYLHYNSGLHIAANGALFAALLADLVAAWPVPLDDLVLLGHSMGGLVARSALRLAPDLPVRRMVFLGTPHHGSPLERTGHIVTTALGLAPRTGPLALLGKLRSAGITDLRHGVIEAHPPAHDRFGSGRDQRRPAPLPPRVACYAIAASLASHRLARAAGDGLVPVASALGHHADPALALGLPDERTHVACGVGHLDLLDHPEVYAQLLRFLAPAPA